MSRNIEQAKLFAESLRFSEEQLTSAPEPDYANSLRNMFLTQELAITKDVTPSLYKSLEKVLIRLHVPIECVDAFVYASPEINASCIPSGNNNCVLRFTSALVDILNADELEFIIAHEVGHFLLSHYREGPGENACLETLVNYRAQEISADRIGLIGCESLNASIKALIKLVSGLGDKHLTFNVGSYLTQLKKGGSHLSSSFQTHPSILVRCRALMWFSMNENYKKHSLNFERAQIIKLDKKIQGDLDNYIDKAIKVQVTDCKKRLLMWLSIHKMILAGRFSKSQQESFSSEFGEDTLLKMKQFISSLHPRELNVSVEEKIARAKGDLKALIPITFENEYQLLVEKIKS